MARAADTGGAGSAFVKFTEIGDTFVGAFGSSPNECRRQARDFTTGNPALTYDGQHPSVDGVAWLARAIDETIGYRS